MVNIPKEVYRRRKNIIYLNLGRGVAIGIIVDGKIYYGRSGFAGEFGHTPFFEKKTKLFAIGGKKGCLRPKFRGFAIENKMIAQIQKDATRF